MSQGGRVSHHSPFRRCVRTVFAVRPTAGGRSYVDYDAAFSLHHVGNHCPADQVHSPQIGVHHLVPLLHSGRPHRCVVGYHPGVVDQHVYPAPRPDDLLGDPGCVIVSGNVQGEGRHITSCSPNLLRHPLQAVHVPSGQRSWHLRERSTGQWPGLCLGLRL